MLRQFPVRTSCSKGFTLLEIMLVLVLLSLGAVTVVMNFPSSKEDLAKEEAMRFYHRLQLLNEEAVLSGRDFGVRFEESAGRYLFLELRKEGWQQAELKQKTEQELPEGIALVFSPGSSAWNNNESLFNNTSLFDDEMFSDLEPEKSKQKPPQVFVFSSGEITPFNLTLKPDDKSQQSLLWQVNALENGVIELLAPGEESSEVLR